MFAHKSISKKNSFFASLLATGYVGPVDNIMEKGVNGFPYTECSVYVENDARNILATLARLFRVPSIGRDKGLNSRIVSCLSSASAIAVPYAIPCYNALRYTGTDCMWF